METKPVETKTAETKPTETKVNAKSTDTKSTDVKSTDAKTTDAKSTKPVAPESLPKTGDGGSILSYLGSSSIISGLATLIKRRKNK